MQNFKRKIRLEILGADLVIDDADISLDITKTDEPKVFNSCEIAIYNVSDDLYNKINNKTNAVRVYTDTDNSGYSLLFEGYLRDLVKQKQVISKNKGKKKNKKVIDLPAIERKTEGNDIATIIYLEDGRKNTFLVNSISKSYQNAVTNIFVLDDILKDVKRMSSNVKISANLSSLKEYTYPNGITFKGNLKQVLNNICKTGDAYCTIQNDVILIASDMQAGDNLVYTYLLNGENCPSPEMNSQGEIQVQAPFINSINPFNFIKLDFRDYNGVFKVKKIESKIDNFGQNYETKITVKVNN